MSPTNLSPDPTHRQFYADAVYGEVVVVAPEFKFQQVNDAFCQLLEYSEADLVGSLGVGDVTHPDDLATSRELLGRLARRELGQFVAQKRYVARSGRVIDALTFVRPLFDGAGTMVGAEASIVDVTDQVRAVAELRERESRFRTLFEAASDAIFLVRDGRFVDCNARTLEMFGCVRDEIVGRHPGEFSPPEQRDGSPSAIAADARMGAALAGGRTSFDWLHCRKDGTPFDAEVTLAPVELGGRLFLQAIVRDVTERRQIEREKLELERRLLEAQKLESLGVLAGGVAHDFNNLLMAMLGNLELAARDLSPVSPARPRLEAATAAARRAAEVTRQMLAYSGRGGFKLAGLDLNELVGENVHLLRDLLSAGATLELRLAPGVAPIEADSGQVRQVIVNLVTNAAEALGDRPGVITLTTGSVRCDAACLAASRLDPKPPPGLFTWLEVADTGCGMDEETRKRIFEPFFSTKFTGRGLGLAAVIGIVRGHGGAILLDSAPGQGTTVRVLLPASRPAGDGAVPGR